MLPLSSFILSPFPLKASSTRVEFFLISVTYFYVYTFLPFSLFSLRRPKGRLRRTQVECRVLSVNLSIRFFYIPSSSLHSFLSPFYRNVSLLNVFRTETDVGGDDSDDDTSEFTVTSPSPSHFSSIFSLFLPLSFLPLHIPSFIALDPQLSYSFPLPQYRNVFYSETDDILHVLELKASLVSPIATLIGHSDTVVAVGVSMGIIITASAGLFSLSLSLLPSPFPLLPPHLPHILSLFPLSFSFLLLCYFTIPIGSLISNWTHIDKSICVWTMKGKMVQCIEDAHKDWITTVSSFELFFWCLHAHSHTDMDTHRLTRSHVLTHTST